MRRLRRLPNAIRDLDQIWLHVAQHDIHAADRLIADLLDSTQILLSYPYSGPAKPHIAPDMRTLSVRRYTILYRVTDHVIDIVRVVHQARDIDQIEID